jgi:hypothetical protein
VASSKIDKQLYWMDPAFERRVAYLCCTSPTFWARVGSEVDPDCLNVEASRLVLVAARLIAHDTGRPPESPVVVLQRLRRQMDDGKVTYDQVLSAQDYFLDEAETGDLRLTEDAVVAELAPILRKRLERAAVLKVMEEAGKGADEDAPLPETTKLIERAARVGKPVEGADPGLVVGEQGGYDAIHVAKRAERLSTGVEDLDILLRGGPRRGGLQVWIGGTGAGKSVSLVQRVCVAARAGLHVALATLELTIETQLARVKANLTGAAIDDILDDPDCVKGALSLMSFGPIRIQTFSSPTTRDLFAWVDACELAEAERRGMPPGSRVPVDLLSIDYGDLIVTPPTVGKDADHGYSVGKHVFGGLRTYAEGQKKPGDGGHPGGPIWVDTACAATRDAQGHKRKHLGTNDVADSLHKMRRATLAVSINPQEDGTIEWWVDKNSHGPAKFGVGPLPADLASARIAPIVEV